MTVVSDASPLIALARVGQLGLLSAFYGRVLIAAEVYDEVTVAGHGLPGAEEVRRASWIETAKPAAEPNSVLRRALEGLGAGERGTILLAHTISADLVLVDDAKARRAARQAGLTVLGCLGVLEAAARKTLILDLRQTYRELLGHGIRFDLRLLDASLDRLGLPKL
ncbi:MAG: hypothetical protein WD733_00965 [Bryobacterales bacterium]